MVVLSGPNSSFVHGPHGAYAICNVFVGVTLIYFFDVEVGV